MGPWDWINRAKQEKENQNLEFTILALTLIKICYEEGFQLLMKENIKRPKPKKIGKSPQKLLRDLCVKRCLKD